MARNFSEDGAAGAMTGGTEGQPTGGFTSGSLKPSIMNNFNMTGTPAGGASSMPIGLGDSDIGGSGGFGGGGMASDQGTDGTIGGIPTGGMYSDHGGGWGGGIAPMGGADHGGGMSSPMGSSYPTSPSWSFAAGGAINDDPNATDPQGSAMGNSLQQSINQALSTVTDVLSYGRNLHGIGGQQKQAMNTDGFTQSGNIEDRRDSDNSPDPNSLGESMKRRVGSRVDQVKNMFGPDMTKNKMSQDAGINDIDSGGDAQPSAQAGAQQAIPTDEEEAQ